MASEAQDESSSLLPGELSQETWEVPEAPSCAESELVLRWLLQADASDVKLLLSQVENQRPEIFLGLKAQTSIEQRGTSGMMAHPCAKSMLATDGLQKRRHLDFLAAKKEPPIVQFTSFMYFCREEETHISLTVMRIGDLSSKSEVHYKTRDSTAKAGIKYVATEGKVCFERGEDEQSFEILLINGEAWDTTTEFIVELENEPAPVHCVLGRYLWMARVKVADTDCFPSNKYQSLIASNEWAKISKWGLLGEYRSLNWRHPVVRKGSIKMLLCDFFDNLYFFSRLTMRVYLVDKILKAKEENPDGPLLLVAGLLALPLILMHILDFRRLTWKVGGASRATLQQALIRRFLNYDEESRSKVTASDLVMAATVQVPELVNNGYCSMIALWKDIGKMFFILLFETLAPFIFDKDFYYTPLIFFCVFPFLQIAFLVMRRATTLRVLDIQQDKHADLVGQTGAVVSNYRMIAAYNRRPFFVDRVSQAVSQFNKASVQSSLVSKNNAYFPLWLSILAVAGYTFIGGRQHIDDPESLTLGMFLAHLKVIGTIGQVWGAIYGHLIEMECAIPALFDIVRLLNLRLDIPQRSTISRAKSFETAAKRQSSSDMIGFPEDNAPIVLENVGYDYRGHGEIAGAVEFTGKIYIEQGEMVSLMGPRGQGKATVLRLLSEVFLPKPGGFFVPAHLRGIHVASGPLFFTGTLYENLAFGVAGGDQDASVARVLKIVSRLGLPDKVLKMIDGQQDENAHPWSQVLSYTQQCLLTLARAFIANPELLCAERPTMPFGEASSMTVMRMFREFCDEKGIEQDPSQRHQRRPRTSVITKARLASLELYDKIFLVTTEGIKHVKNDEVVVSMVL